MECPNCGKEIDEDSKFCPTCGKLLGGESAEPAAAPETGTQPPAPGAQAEPAPPESPPSQEGAQPAAAVEGTPTYPPPATYSGRPPSGPKNSGWAIASLVLGILGFTCLFVIGSILAIIFGFVGRHEIRRSEGRLKGSGMATAGITLGIVLLGLVILFAAVVIPVSFLSVGSTRTLVRTVGVGSARTVNANFDMSNGDLRISGGATSLMRGIFNYNVDRWRPQVSYSVTGAGNPTAASGATGTLTVRQPSAEWWHWGQWWHGKNNWDIRLGSGIPIDLKVNKSWGTGNLDMAGVNLTSLDASSSAGELSVGLGGTMPSLRDVRVDETAGRLRLTMDGWYPSMDSLDVGNSAGAVSVDLTGQWTRNLTGTIRNTAGGITVRLPRGVGVYVTAKTSAGHVQASGFDSRGDGVYVNGAYGKSPVTLDLSIRNSAGSITLELE